MPTSDGNVQRPPRPEARRRRRPAARDSTADRPGALGARPQVPRDRPRDLRRGLPGGLGDPAERRAPEPVEIDEVLSTFDEPTRVAIQENLFEFGNALAGRGPDLNAALGRAARHGRATSTPVMRNLAVAEHAAGAVHQRQRRRRRRGRPGRRDPGRPVRQPRHHVHRARRGRAAVHPGHDLRDAADLRRRRSRRFPVIRPFLDHSAQLFTRPAAGRARDLAATAPTIADTLETGTPVLARLAAAQPPAAADRGGAAAPSTTTRTCATGSAA